MFYAFILWAYTGDAFFAKFDSVVLTVEAERGSSFRFVEIF